MQTGNHIPILKTLCKGAEEGTERSLYQEFSTAEQLSSISSDDGSNKELILIYSIYKNTMENQTVLLEVPKQPPSEDQCSVRQLPESSRQPEAMNSVATITDIKGLVHSHIPEFSKKHPTIPKRYVMPWKQDMVNRKLILRHSDLAEVYRGPQDESLFLENKERRCHGEERHVIMEKMKIPSQIQITDLPLHSPFSRYNSYIINQRSRMPGPQY